MIDLEKPVNVQERYLYGINLRLDALIEIMNSLVEHYAKQHDVAVTNNTVVEKTPKRRKVSQ